jgi:putative ABC transport system ATP-binding protein
MSVRLREITKTYRAEGREVTALRGISLNADDGELVGILGASTSGKSTLMHILGLLDRPTSGSFELDGVDVARLSDADLTGIRNHKIGLVFRSYHLLPRMSVMEEVELPLMYSDLKARRHTLAAEALQAVGLGEHLQRTLSELSDEQAPRVALARAVVMHPSLLLFPDEAEFELDEHMLQQIWREVQDLRRQRSITMFLTPHTLAEAEECDRIAILAAGRLAAFDSPDALKQAVGSECIEIRTGDPDALARLLLDRFGVQSRCAEGLVQITTSAAADLVPRLRADLSIGAENISTRPSTLEDACHVYSQSTAGEVSGQISRPPV